jgi:predicted nucleic acid-binding protein
MARIVARRGPRRAPAHAAVDELRRLVVQGRAGLVGPIRQELLSGIRDRAVFERLRDHLRAFPDEPITSIDYERAADCLDLCRAKGIQGSNTDFLLCAVAERAKCPILTTDDDFVTFSRVLPVRLHAVEQGPHA